MRIFIALALASCVAEPDVDTTEQAATTAFANDKAALDFFVGKGLTNFQAAGIVGNLDQESGVNPNSVQSGGPGRGIAQWSTGGRWDTSAHDNATAYAASQNEGLHTLNLQLEFIWYELQTYSGYGLAGLKATTNVTDATVEFMTKFEICGNCLSTQRVNYAKDVLNAYGQIEYSGTYVSETWPLASAPALQVKCGESVAAKLVLKNSGTKTWNTDTALGTTEPRDRTSIFSGADWAAPNRAAKITGTVAPGANGTFTFAFDGPTGDACVPGTYHEHFGIVQDGTSWFTDPADDQIEALIELVPGDGTGSGSDTGSDTTGGGGDDMGSDATSSGQSTGCNAGGGGGWLGALFVGLLLATASRRR